MLKDRTVVDINDTINGVEFTLDAMSYDEILLSEWEKTLSSKEHV